MRPALMKYIVAGNELYDMQFECTVRSLCSTSHRLKGQHVILTANLKFDFTFTAFMDV